MALATRCPNCQSMFVVVSDQLKLRGGLVRCGSCRHVFDAISSLSYVEDVGASAPAAATPRARVPPPGPEATSPAVHPRQTARPSDETRLRPHDAASRDAAPEPPSTSHDAAPVDERPDALAVPTLLAPNVPELTESESAAAAGPDALAEGQPAPEARRSRVRERDTARDPVPGAGTAERPPAAPQRDSGPDDRTVGQPTTADSGEDAPEFLRAGRDRNGFSIVFGGGSLLLALLLVAQSMIVFRTDILTRWPELRPRLVDLCTVFGCAVGWPTRAELLAVIGTELQAVPGTDILELTTVIRNRAAHRVALPAVEVTLTDTLNRTLARKVFAPADYLASAGEPSSRVDEGLGAGSDIVVRIVFEARGLNASGFVVYPFYL